MVGCDDDGLTKALRTGLLTASDGKETDGVDKLNTDQSIN